ncbi:MAG: hypothetical protein CMF37_15520 [Leeuwenhoekiella sp.]|nr:hypothetical protein [Leeuwenhoekiella sp.]MBH14322.1 hypothetical protein [Leeuwenhoekiella sp.]MBQ50170.1 hypothetical protein [Leeuwenhoekiella sp.]MBQ50367.1 hypothetical protein [Leeuwenhoekiella sp.]MBQ50564.1 hypothetical protein [Leeuwenhoekiella sp.]|tara:strand:+ start:4572 stop:5537 length:966 start_codon:yes stop_codon:yes gene_type:complete
MSKHTLRIYAAGGCATNLAKPFVGLESSDIYADIDPVFVDTSMSNIEGPITEEMCYILPDVDGSGKVRRENHQRISDSIKDIVSIHPPGDFNIVMFSAAGGSGSVAGPLIARHLLEIEAPLICIVVGSTDSAITCTNTLNTLKSLDSISQAAELPITLFYEENGAGVKRSEIDKRVKGAIGSISALVSGNNRELDTKDISTWVYYNRASKVEPQLSQLSILRDNTAVEGLNEPISIASLLADPDTEMPEAAPDYQCIGYHRDQSGEVPDMHLVISVNGIERIYEGIAKAHGTYEKSTSKRSLDRKTFVGGGDQVTKDGMVL